MFAAHATSDGLRPCICRDKGVGYPFVMIPFTIASLFFSPHQLTSIYFLSKESYYLEENDKKVTFKKDEKIPNAATFQINKEDHTLGNLLVRFASPYFLFPLCDPPSFFVNDDFWHLA